MVAEYIASIYLSLLLPATVAANLSAYPVLSQLF